tara:strand:- start:92 stop:193 length:102 start_codon:yes stop_codon:yes gene_type:complete
MEWDVVKNPYRNYFQIGLGIPQNFNKEKQNEDY